MHRLQCFFPSFLPFWDSEYLHQPIIHSILIKKPILHCPWIFSESRMVVQGLVLFLFSIYENLKHKSRSLLELWDSERLISFYSQFMRFWGKKILFDFKDFLKQIKASHHDHKHKTEQGNEYETFTFSKALVGKDAEEI